MKEMAKAIVMPKVGITVESCILTKWNIKVGDVIKPGQVLFTYETDKTSAECESEIEGTVLELFYSEGDDVPALINVCAVGQPGEDVSALRPEGASAAAPAEEAATPAEEAPAAAPIEVKAPSGFVLSSPRARAVAEKLGVDYRVANGTGPNGRVIEADVRKLAENGIFATKTALAAGVSTAAGSGIGGRAVLSDLNAAPSVSSAAAAAPAASEAAYTVSKMSNIRKTIAKAMLGSLQNGAQLTLNSSFDATDIMALRAKLKLNEKTAKITLNDILLFAVSRTLLDHKNVNTTCTGEELKTYNTVNLGVASDTDRGLLVPVIPSAEKLSLSALSAQAKVLIGEAKSGTISPDKMANGSFTVTNLGSLGVESFTPVINLPQVAILGVCSIVQRPRKASDGSIELYPAMGLSLTFDHRVLDGAPAARFLADLVKNLENFTMLLV